MNPRRRIEVDLPGVEDIVVSQLVAVCDQIESVLVGSSATDDGSGGGVETGHTEQVCTEWHYAVVER